MTACAVETGQGVRGLLLEHERSQLVEQSLIEGPESQVMLQLVLMQGERVSLVWTKAACE